MAAITNFILDMRNQGGCIACTGETNFFPTPICVLLWMNGQIVFDDWELPEERFAGYMGTIRRKPVHCSLR